MRNIKLNTHISTNTVHSKEEALIRIEEHFNACVLAIIYYFNREIELKYNSGGVVVHVWNGQQFNYIFNILGTNWDFYHHNRKKVMDEVLTQMSKDWQIEIREHKDKSSILPDVYYKFIPKL